MSLLNAHENIKMYGELFNLDSLPEASLKETLENPIGYLDKRLTCTLPPQVQAVGFKMFYDHLTPEYFEKMINRREASEGLLQRIHNLEAFIRAHTSRQELLTRFEAAWNYLRNDTGLKVIHLRRKNKLETLVSLKTAFLTDEWMHVHNKQRPKTVLQLNFEECFQYFNKLEAYESDYSARFTEHDALEVVYEDLVEKTNEEMSRIFDFLGLPRQQVRTILKKQIVASLPEVIGNYADLKKSFESSKWQAYFN